MSVSLISIPRRYANLAEVMHFANSVALSEADFPIDLPHASDEIQAAWKTWLTEEAMDFVAIGKRFHIEPGFMTDFASIPKPLRWLFDPVGAPWQVAAVAHDYLYSSAPVTRKEADQVYLAICGALGVKHWRARLMYDALRVGGWMAWRKNRKNLIELGSLWRFIK